MARKKTPHPASSASLSPPTFEPPSDWAGHVILDNGLAGALVRAGRRRGALLDHPSQLTAEDLQDLFEAVADGVAHDEGLTHLWAQNFVAVKGQDAARLRAIVHERLSVLDPLAAAYRCRGCGRPAVVMADRKYLPMAQAEGVINTGPGGAPGTPLCRTCLLVSAGVMVNLPPFNNVWVLVDGDPDLIVAVQRQMYVRALVYQEERRRVKQDDRKKIGNGAAHEGLVAAVRDAAREQEQARGGRPRYGDSEVVLLSPVGPNPKVFRVPLRSGLWSFLTQVSRASSRGAWRWADLFGAASGERVTVAAKPKKPKKGAAPPETEPGEPKVKVTTPDESLRLLVVGQDDARMAMRLVRRLVLTRGLAGGPAVMDAARRVAELYLTEVLGMRQDRLDHIHAVGDRIAELIERDPRLHRKFFGPPLGEVKRELRYQMNRGYLKEEPPIFSGTDAWSSLVEDDDAGVPVKFADAWMYVSVHVHARLWEAMQTRKATARGKKKAADGDGAPGFTDGDRSRAKDIAEGKWEPRGDGAERMRPEDMEELE